jgi:hypothetical protein
MSDNSSNREPTVGEIARLLNAQLHRVDYVIRSRRIRPTRIAGNCRVFSEEAVELIKQELLRITAGKEQRRPTDASSHG